MGMILNTGGIMIMVLDKGGVIIKIFDTEGVIMIMGVVVGKGFHL